MKTFYRIWQILLIFIAPFYSARIHLFKVLNINDSHHDVASLVLAICYAFSAVLLLILEWFAKREEIQELNSTISSLESDKAALEAEKAAVRPIIEDFKRRSKIELDKKELANEQKKLKVREKQIEFDKEIREGNKNFEDASSLASFQEGNNNES